MLWQGSTWRIVVAAAVCILASGVVADAREPAPVHAAFALTEGGTACAPKGLCIAIGGGYTLASSTPASGPEAWHRTATNELRSHDVSCPSARLCVALGISEQHPYGSTSTDPTNGKSWRQAGLKGLPKNDHYFLDMDCPSTRLCVAVGQYQQVATPYGYHGLVAFSRHPAGGSRSWHIRLLTQSDGLGSVSCPTKSLC